MSFCPDKTFVCEVSSETKLKLSGTKILSKVKKSFQMTVDSKYCFWQFWFCLRQNSLGKRFFRAEGQGITLKVQGYLRTYQKKLHCDRFWLWDMPSVIFRAAMTGFYTPHSSLYRNSAPMNLVCQKSKPLVWLYGKYDNLVNENFKTPKKIGSFWIQNYER